MTGSTLALGLLSFAVMTLLGGGMSLGADDHETGRKLEDAPKLSVRGEAELLKPADQLQMRIGVVTEAREAGQALDDNGARMREVVKAIEDAGLTKDEYETGRFRIRPSYARRPRQAPADWKPQIVGYEVTNDVLVKTKQLDLAGKVIEVANKAGANTIDVVGFTLSDPRAHRKEAIGEATRNAIEDATTLAAAAGIDLVRIVAINLDHSPIRTDRAMGRMAMAAESADGAPPITPGDVTVRASVNIVYEIAPSH